MIPKMLKIATAMLMPVGMVAGVALTSGVASAKTPPTVTPATCPVTGTVQFAAPGLSTVGAVEASSKSTTTTTVSTSGACTGSNTNSIVSKSTVKCKSQPTTAPCTGTVGYVFDTSAGFAGGSTITTLNKALKKGLVVDDSGTSLTLVPTAADTAAILPGKSASDGACGIDSGFHLDGTLKKATGTWTANICLDDDSGTGVTGNFTNDILTPGVVVAGATLGSSTATGANSFIQIAP